MTDRAPLSSQLILRSTDRQLVIGSTLAAHQLAEISEAALAHSPRHTPLTRIWGTLCAQVVRQQGNRGELTLSIPAQSALPTVWVSEAEPGQFVVTADSSDSNSWVVVETGGASAKHSAVRP